MTFVGSSTAWAKWSTEKRYQQEALTLDGGSGLFRTISATGGYQWDLRVGLHFDVYVAIAIASTVPARLPCAPDQQTSAPLYSRRHPDAQLAARVERVVEKPLSDGLSIDNAGNVYITDVEHNAVFRVGFFH